MNRYLVLDSLRGVMACMIVLLHSPFDSNLIASSFVRNSFVFVDFFFVLSGFIMHRSYFLRMNDSRDILFFIIARFARLWPLHLFIMFIFATIYVAKELVIANSASLGGNDSMTHVQVFQHAITDAFLLNALRPSLLYFWNFPTWSISAEVFCYLVFAAVCLAPNRLRFLAALAILLFSWGVILDLIPIKFANTIISAWGAFFIGYLTSEIRGHRIKSLPFWASTSVEVLVSSGIVILILNLSAYPEIRIVIPLVFGAAIYFFASEGGFISKILNFKIFVTVGVLSYSIYMIHILFFTSLQYVAKVAEVLSGRSYFKDVVVSGGNLTSLLSFGSKSLMDILTISCLLFIIILSSLTYRVIEDPSRKYLRNLLPGNVRDVHVPR